MSRTDLVSDVFSIIRNAIAVKREFALVPFSQLVLKIIELLHGEGYIENFKVIELGNFKKIKVYLKYEGKKSVITELKKVSKPGRKIYFKSKDIRPILEGYGVAMVSTSQGLLTDRLAREKKIGGEIIGIVW